MSETKMLDSMTTITGEPVIAALNALDEKLPDGAYKPVSLGGRKFTDISPSYSLEEIGSHFGPLGIGWGYEVKDELTEIIGDKLSVTLRITLWFVCLSGNEQRRVEWDAYGGNANAAAKLDRHFCWQGALTNAIGKGWSLQGFQRTIYKGEDFTMEQPENGQPTDNASAPKTDNRVRAVWGKARALGWDDETLFEWLTEKTNGAVNHPDMLGGKALGNCLDALQRLIDEQEAAA